MTRTVISYRTPLGTFANYLAAAAACERADFDPVEAVWILKTKLQWCAGCGAEVSDEECPHWDYES